MNIIEKQLIALITTITAVAKNLGVSRLTIYAWLAKYNEDGLLGLIDDHPGPKSGKAWNKTRSETEALVVSYLKDYPLFGPQPLAQLLFEDHGIKLDPTTIRRIGKRMHVRYGIAEGRIPKRDRTLDVDVTKNEDYIPIFLAK